MYVCTHEILKRVTFEEHMTMDTVGRSFLKVTLQKWHQQSLREIVCRDSSGVQSEIAGSCEHLADKFVTQCPAGVRLRAFFTLSHVSLPAVGALSGFSPQLVGLLHA